MERINKFYVANLNTTFDVFFKYSWATGQFAQDAAGYIGSSVAIDVKGHSRIVIDSYYTKGKFITIYFLDDSQKVVSTRTMPNGKVDISTEDASYFAYSVSLSVDYSGRDTLEYSRLKEVKPYYKNIKKQFKKESNQMFFRESINGTITLRGIDYKYVNNISIEDNIGFYIYRNGSLYAANEFNKIDCKINHSEGSIELKLSPKDNYTKILDSYDNTNDLIKLPIRKSEVQFTKRGVIQLYFQGENTITNYAGGTYWEDEVLSPIDEANALMSKYHFSQGETFAEINLSGFNYDDLNTTFRMVNGQNVWNGVKDCSIVFTKVASAGTSGTIALCLSDGASIAYRYEEGPGGDSENPDDDVPVLLYDAYRIEIYSSRDGKGNRIYKSESVYGNDSNFMIKQGARYKMVKVSQSVPYMEPEPSEFYLGENIISRSLWGRLLCDVDKDSDGKATYDVPGDDFAVEVANFRKCIGLRFDDEGMNLVHFKQSTTVQDDPTPFGVNYSGKYFVAPRIYGSVAYEIYPYPFGRSGWGNTSLWVGFEENENTSLPGVERFLKKFYKSITHKDCMELGAVIKAILNKIDTSIKFDSTAEYSEFLYGTTSNTLGAEGQRVYITQKSNVLKGEYDQAAQKAEITFGQLMNMLRNCFRCYWYIDADRRFRIEHVRYFMNGLSYSTPSVQYDLTKKYDKFNKKAAIYGQNKVSFSKSELKSRYEFAWSDEATEMMGGGFYVDVKAKYVEQGGTESVNIELFSPDIDFMMFAPERFSQDGFALIVTDSNNKVPIQYATAHNQQNPGVKMTNYVQNYYASFLHLFNNYLYDIPAQSIISSADYESDSTKKYYAKGLKKFVHQEIKFQTAEDPDIYKLIGTQQGNGTIEELSIYIDSVEKEATLSYTP